MSSTDLWFVYNLTFPGDSFDQAIAGSMGTVIFEMASFKLRAYKTEGNELKIIYIAPLEIYISWEDNFREFNPRGIEITGDDDLTILNGSLINVNILENCKDTDLLISSEDINDESFIFEQNGYANPIGPD